MNGLPGNPTTNASGVYSGTVTSGWSGTVTPTLAGYIFAPVNRVYTNVTSSQTAQNYTAMVQTQINLLHSFAGAPSDGSSPNAPLVISGSTLYGMSAGGGVNGLGTIFKIQTNGTNFALLHSFAGGSEDGANPEGSLIISGSIIYGMTKKGGNSGNGTIFKIQADGSGFTLLHEFSWEDGIYPCGSLVLGSTLYGMTTTAGFGNTSGTVFKIQTDGSGFTLLKEFANDTGDGYGPSGSLILDGSILYGMTCGGGGSDFGTIFKIQIDGTGYAILHEFAGGAGDGKYPDGSLVLSGSTLYGMTPAGGAGGVGMAFKIQTNGTGFTSLYEFPGGIFDPNPTGSLILSGSTLLGTVSANDDSDVAAVFCLQNDGSGFTWLHEFSSNPQAYSSAGSLLLSGSTLYGMTGFNEDPVYNEGLIFSLPLSLCNSIIVTSPNGYESWQLGSNHNITWTSSGTIANVKIEYSTNYGGDYSTIIASTANTGTYAWTVPNTPSTQCLIRISDAANAATSDSSNTVFSIVPSTVPTITITSPNGGEERANGCYLDIQWDYSNITGNVDIELYKDGRSVFAGCSGCECKELFLAHSN